MEWKSKLIQRLVPVRVISWSKTCFNNKKQGKSKGFDSCDRPSILTKIGFKSLIFEPMWPGYLMEDLENNRAHLLYYVKLCASFQSHRWITGPTHKLPLSFTAISDVTGPLFEIKLHVYTRYCLTQRISKLCESFEIHWVRQYLTNFTDMACIANITVYKSEPVFTGLGHGNLSEFLTLLIVICFSLFIFFFSSISIPWQWGKASGAIQKDIKRDRIIWLTKARRLANWLALSPDHDLVCMIAYCLCTTVRYEIVSLFYTGVGDILKEPNLATAFH